MAGFDTSGNKDSEDEISSFEDLKNFTRNARSDFGDQKLDIGIYGREKTGKSHFGLSAPDPILYIDTEGGTKAIEGKFADKDIRIAEISEAGSDFKEDKIKTWERFDQIVRQAVEHEDEIETVVVDSGSDIWESVRAWCKDKLWNKAPEEKLDQQWDWGEINSRYTNALRKLVQADFNLIFTARGKPEYESAGNPTGNYDPDWQRKTGHWMTVVVENQKRWVGENNDKKELYSVIESSRFDGQGEDTVMGTEITWMEFDDLLEVIKKAQEMGDE